MSNCSTGSCKSSDRIWGLSSQDGSRIHRLTFSRSLAEFLSRTYGFQMDRYRFRIGREIVPGETLNRGCYAIISKKSEIPLRISLHPGIAQMYACDGSRYLRQAFIERS